MQWLQWKMVFNQNTTEELQQEQCLLSYIMIGAVPRQSAIKYCALDKFTMHTERKYSPPLNGTKARILKHEYYRAHIGTKMQMLKSETHASHVHFCSLTFPPRSCLRPSMSSIFKCSAAVDLYFCLPRSWNWSPIAFSWQASSLIKQLIKQCAYIANDVY